MRGPRFSIGTLLAVIAILGVAMAALRNPSYLWAALTFTAALLAVLAATASAIFARGARRAYWLGFSLFGGTYLAICTAPGLHDAVCPRLATEALFDFLYPLMAPADPVAPTLTAQLVAPTATFALQPLSPPPAAPSTPATPYYQWQDDLVAPATPNNPIPPPAPGTPVPWTVQPGPAPVPITVVWNANLVSPPLSRWAAWTQPDRTVGVGYTIGTVSLVSSEAFRRIGHSLSALLLASLGAAFARNRYEAHARLQRDRDDPTRTQHDSSFNDRFGT
jgi:hypothetical protein